MRGHPPTCSPSTRRKRRFSLSSSSPSTTSCQSPSSLCRQTRRTELWLSQWADREAEAAAVCRTKSAKSATKLARTDARFALYVARLTRFKLHGRRSSRAGQPSPASAAILASLRVSARSLSWSSEGEGRRALADVGGYASPTLVLPPLIKTSPSKVRHKTIVAGLVTILIDRFQF